MQKTILTLLLFFMSWTSLFAEDEIISRTNVPLNHQERPITKHPQAPARIPVVCSHDEYSVFIESRYSLFADITVEDEAGTTVASTAAMLTPEQPLTLSINDAGTFEITIQIGDTIYSGTFTL